MEIKSGGGIFMCNARKFNLNITDFKQFRQGNYILLDQISAEVKESTDSFAENLLSNAMKNLYDSNRVPDI